MKICKDAAPIDRPFHQSDRWIACMGHRRQGVRAPGAVQRVTQTNSAETDDRGLINIVDWASTGGIDGGLLRPPGTSRHSACVQVSSVGSNHHA
jgi:hypothetical protein